nr:cysteine-rich repeat secretory protein 55 [Ipomoea batatas]
MGLFRHLLLASFCCTIICSIFTAVKSTDALDSYCNSDNSPINSPTPATVQKLIANVVAGASRAGFATASLGGPGTKAYGLAQCRGDVSAKDCASCLQDAGKEIGNRCAAGGRDARIWYDFCFLRYSADAFFGKVDTGYNVLWANVGQVSDPEGFSRKLRNLMSEISKEAISPENQGLGKGKRKISAFLNLYALVQCTKDLAPVDCAQCIAIAVGDNFQSFCKDSAAESSRTPLIVPSTRESHSQGGGRREVDKNPRRLVPNPESPDLSQPRDKLLDVFERSEGMEEVGLELLKKKMEDFVKERDWEKHHTPRNLLLNMIGEVGELSEIFQWKGEVAKGLPDWDEAEKIHLGEELSDVLLNLVRLSDVCGIDLGKAALRKVQLNALKYPPPTHHSPTKTQP